MTYALSKCILDRRSEAERRFFKGVLGTWDRRHLKPECVHGIWERERRKGWPAPSGSQSMGPVRARDPPRSQQKLTPRRLRTSPCSEKYRPEHLVGRKLLAAVTGAEMLFEKSRLEQSSHSPERYSRALATCTFARRTNRPTTPAPSENGKNCQGT